MSELAKYWPFRARRVGNTSPLDSGTGSGWFLEYTGFDAMENRNPVYTGRVELAAHGRGAALDEAVALWRARTPYPGWDGRLSPHSGARLPCSAARRRRPMIRRTAAERERNPSVVLHDAPPVCNRCRPLLENEQAMHTAAFDTLAHAFDRAQDEIRSLRERVAYLESALREKETVP